MASQQVTRLQIVTPRLLITGFGPFPGIPENASAGFAQTLAAHARQHLPQTQTYAAVLPTEWEAGPLALRSFIAKIQPTVCLHLGVTGRSGGMTLETHAQNAAGQKRDAAGRLPASGRLLLDAPAVLVPPTSSARLLAQGQLAGGPLSQSLKSGDYVCNSVFFHSLWLARQQAGRRQVAFLHLPVQVGDLGKSDDPAPPDAAITLESALGCALRLLTVLVEPVPMEA